MADYEGEETEIFVFFGIDGWLGALGAVVAEHAELRWGFGFCEGGAWCDEWVEDGGVEIEGLGDCGDGSGHEGAGEIPGGFEIGVEDCGTAG